MAQKIRMVATGSSRRAIRMAVLFGITAFAVADMTGPAAAGSSANSVSATTTASVTVVDYLGLMKFSDIDIGAAFLPMGGHATLELRPSGTLFAGADGETQAKGSFSAVFTLSGSPNQTFGISLPASVTLTSGGSTQSVRTFMHDAGTMPVLAGSGRGRFQVGAILSVGRTSNAKTQVYLGAFDVIVSNN